REVSDQTTGCSASWDAVRALSLLYRVYLLDINDAVIQEASSAALDTKTQFVKECRVKLVGYDLTGPRGLSFLSVCADYPLKSYKILGSSCSNSSDCVGGAQCDAIAHKCNHTYVDVINVHFPHSP